MKKMLDSYGLRVLAFILCCALGLLTVGCALGTAYVSYEPGMGADDEPDFFNSELAKEYALSRAWDLIGSAVVVHRTARVPEQTPEPTPLPAAAAVPEEEEYTEAMPTSYPTDPEDGIVYMATENQPPYEAEFDPANLYLPDPTSGLSFVVRDTDGKILADTRTDDSQLVEGAAVDAYGFTVDAYFNLPAERNNELYGYMTAYSILHSYRTLFLPVGLGAGLLTILLFVFLMAAAGRTPEGVKLGGFHRWPLEIYLGALIGLTVLLVYIMVEFSYREFMRHFALYAALYALGILGTGICALLGCMTLAARFRAGKWWHNTVTFFCLKWTWVLLLWCGKWIWKAVCWFARATKAMVRGIGNLFRSLPLTWRSAAAYCAFLFLNIVLAMNAIWNGEGWFVLLLFLDLLGLLAVIWVSMQLRRLQAAGKALAAGDLSASVDTKHMLPVLREHADNLGAVSLGMTRAVNERMKSERFKTELITNVSHDLKTPLTSIVSYVDLLKNEPIENEKAREYIEVLDRQSQRLKKLTTDLVDASKASSGALTVEAEPVDLGELLRQSAGEYAERFALGQLTPVLGIPEGETVITADGRLLWRVLDNLLTNVVKYALPGTRVYLDLTRQDGETILSVKNISREPLNIPAEELMERFVRGDASRSSEGSGLGLSIARSLTELMGGQLRLTLDGDLFKAELVFRPKS